MTEPQCGGRLYSTEDSVSYHSKTASDYCEWFLSVPSGVIEVTIERAKVISNDEANCTINVIKVRIYLFLIIIVVCINKHNH